jgi:hypothetical protein
MFAETFYAIGNFIGENPELLFFRIEDGLVFLTGLTMVMFHGDPLTRRVTEVIDRVVEAGQYNYWISLCMHLCKLFSRKTAAVHQLNGYYSFRLYHRQHSFYLH